MKNLAHVVPFYGNPKSSSKPVSGVNYRSNDLRVIDCQLELISRCMYDGVIVLWYGDVDPFINDVCEKFLFLCEKRQMLFGLCVDPWAMGTNKATMTVEQRNAKWSVLLGLANNFLKSPSYLPEKYIIDFATLADIPTVEKQNPGYDILQVYKEVAWPKMVNDPKANLILQNTTAIIPGVMHSFSDYDSNKPSDSIWGGPARRIDAQDGQFELDTIKAITANHGIAKYVQRITWNDYKERTSCERQVISSMLLTGEVDVTPLL